MVGVLVIVTPVVIACPMALAVMETTLSGTKSQSIDWMTKKPNL